MDAIVTLRIKIKDLSEDTLLVLKQMVLEESETDEEVSDREAVIFAAIEWLATGEGIGGEAYVEEYKNHSVHIYNRDEKVKHK